MREIILQVAWRISDESSTKPKPMIEIGSKPTLRHIMKIFPTYGIHEFILCCGYQGHMIKEYYASYFLHMSDASFDMKNNKMEVHRRHADQLRWHRFRTTSLSGNSHVAL